MSTRTISPGMGSTGHIMCLLIPFNMMVDTDVGLLSFIFKNYRDPRVFNLSFFEHKTVKQLVLDLYKREKENPLYLCLNEDYMDKADDFYNQFMEREYENILNLSVVTEYFGLASIFNKDSDTSVAINCERPIEVDLLKSRSEFKKANVILTDSLTPAKIDTDYNQFFFKSIGDAIPFAALLKAKTVYFADYGFNLAPDGGFIDHPALQMLQKRNDIMITQVYDMKKLKGDKDGV